MKKIEIFAGLVSIVVIISTVFYGFRMRLIDEAGNRSLYVVGAIVVGVFLILASDLIIKWYILRKRTDAFRDLAKKFSLEHTHSDYGLFIPYEKLNSLRGSINNHTVEIYDESFKPTTDKLVADAVISSVVAYTPRKSYNMDTKIYLDGKNVTPDYQQKWIFYRNPFMQVSEIEKYLRQI